MDIVLVAMPFMMHMCIVV